MAQKKGRSLLLYLASLAACMLLAFAECPRWRGRFRDCTCGVSYRDEETRCCTADTCEAPVLISRNLTCPFFCMNGGIRDRDQLKCSCQPGFFGLCCERGESAAGLYRAPVTFYY